MLLQGIIAEEKPGGGGGGSITAPVIRQKVSATGAGSAFCSLPVAALVGSTIIAFVHTWNAGAPTLAMNDDQGNTYTPVSGPDLNATESGGAYRFLFILPHLANTPINFNATGMSGHYGQITVVEVTGCDPSPIDDNIVGSDQTGTAWNSGNLTSTQDNDLLLAFPAYVDFGGTTLISAGALWTMESQLPDTGIVGMRVGLESQVAAVAGVNAVDATLAASMNGDMLAIALKGV